MNGTGMDDIPNEERNFSKLMWLILNIRICFFNHINSCIDNELF
jgi:hypothetical protein